MEISLVSIAFAGYGRFVGQFLAFASAMSPKPTEVVVVLGKDHGCKDIELLSCIYPGVRIVEYKGKPSFGRLRNIGIKQTSAEWTWFVSVDDKPMPDAIETFKRAITEDPRADYICAQWYTIGLDKPLQIHHSPTPQQMGELLNSGKRGGFVIPHSPFKRRLWEKHPYKDSELPNYDFLLHCVKSGARFVKGDKPTTTYLRRPDSHARTKLKTMKKAANREKRIMSEYIKRHYANRID